MSPRFPLLDIWGLVTMVSTRSSHLFSAMDSQLSPLLNGIFLEVLGAAVSSHSGPTSLR